MRIVKKERVSMILRFNDPRKNASSRKNLSGPKRSFFRFD